MFWFLFLSSALAHPTSLIKPQTKQRFSHKRFAASAPVAPLEISKIVISLTKTDTSAAISQRLVAAVSGTGATNLLPTPGEVGYAVNVNFAGESLQLNLDNGSSDTWVASSGLTCLDQYSQTVPVAQCQLGQLYEGSFPEGSIAHENFNISYGDGEAVTGTLEYSDVGIAGVAVQLQEVAIANSAYWMGDGQTSGLLGFAYTAITNALQGTAPDEDFASTRVAYSSVVASADSQGLFTSFSLAVERDGGGYLALGSLPPVDFDQSFASTPVEVTTFIGAPVLAYYTIAPNGYNIGGAGASYSGSIEMVANERPVMVDSGE